MKFTTLLLLITLLVPACALSKKWAVKKNNVLKKGDIAPDFTLIDENGKEQSLSKFKDKKIVLYFYPKDGTADCTKEACQLRDAYEVYKKNDITILGISYDSPESHAKFKKEHHLPFTLLSDSKKKVAKLYSANKNFLGGFYPERKTILIDEHGKIVEIFENVEVKTHSENILKAFGVKS